ncbi:hypothetical protein FQR65_LT04577 [Abscondita terminalis]|nr:hypothetical protein FQR65_LT04577 [Abscondita terminalis]
MKIIALFACMLVFGTASAATKHYRHNERVEVGAPIEQLINSIIQALSDPVHVDIISINILGYRVIVRDATRDGLHSVVVNVSVDVADSIKIRLGISVKEINMGVRSWESNLPVVYGNGTAQLSIKDASALLELELNRDHTAKPSNVEISVGSADYKITGVQNDEALSQMITDKVNNALNVVANDPAFHSKLEAIIDGILSFFKK